MKLCLPCRSFRSASRAVCDVCEGALVEPDDAQLARLGDLLARDRVGALIASWTRSGLVAPKLARRLSATLPRDLAPDAPPPPVEAPPPPVEAPPPPEALPPPAVARVVHRHRDDAQHAGDAAASLFAAPSVTHGALDALASLDAPEHHDELDAPSRWESEVRPLLYENVGWFIGTLFVLAGSVYGVREAWRTLGGVPRHLLVASALLAYHAGFVGLARLLASRSASTGRVLGGIALGLLPVVFVALSSLTALDLAAGVGASLAALVVAALTLRSVSARFEASPGFALAALPLLAAEVPLAGLASDAPLRVALCFAGPAVVAVCAHVALPRREAPERPATHTAHALVAAVYGAVALAVFAVAGSSDAGSDLVTLAPGYMLFAAVFAAVLAAACARPGAALRHPRAAPAVEVVALAVAAVATLYEAGTALSAAPVEAPRCVMAALTAVVAALSFAHTARRHPGALHFVPLAATAAAALAARAIARDDLPWSVFGAMVAPCAAIASGRLLPGDAQRRNRRVLVRWGVVLAVPVGLAATVYGALTYPAATPWSATVAALALLSLTAHGSALPGRRGLRALGALAAVATTFAATLPQRASGDAYALTVGAALTLACAALASLAGLPTRDVEAHKTSIYKTLRDTFASTALASFAAVALLVAVWISSWNDLTRPRAVEASAALLVAALVAFAGRGFPALRASPVALWACGASVALAAVANRVGRPLPPRVVGWRLSAIAVAVWLLARLVVAKGPRVAAWLGRPTEGSRYHLVPHAGVFALAAVLVVDAALVGSPSVDRALLVTPPTMLLGSAVAFALLGRSARNAVWTTAAYGLALAGLALAGAQSSLLGVAAVRVSGTIGAHWVPTGSLAAGDPSQWNVPRALLGPSQTLDGARADALVALACGALLCALQVALLRRNTALRAALARALLDRDDARDESVAEIPSLWSTVSVALVAVSLAFRADLATAALVTAAGALLLVGRARHAGALATAAGAVAIVHALAAREPAVPAWTGVATMLLALAPLQLGPWIARRHRVAPARVFARTQPLTLALALIALFDALAAAQPFTGSWLAGDVAWGALLGLAGRWMRSPALPLTLALAAWASGVAARQWSASDDGDDAAYATAAGSALLAGLAVCAGLTAVSAALYATSPAGLTLPFARGLAALRVLGAPLALASSLVALGAHAAGRHATKPSLAGGARFGRDAWLAGSIVFLAVFSGLARAAQEPVAAAAVPAGVAAMGVGVLVAGHAAWREATARHVYFVQAAIVAVYGLARSELVRALPPEVDALFALVMGFLLVGVTVQARRAGIPPVAVATRRFAALLPFAIALVLPQEASGAAALAAAGSALLYATLGWVERSRLFGSLGAAAANLALLLFALSSGWRGPEVGAVPLGLLVLALGQIFAATLSHGARVTVRIVGSLLVYLPAALQVAFQVGNARDGAYPVLFGLACLAGVAAGMLLQIRAYLALGLGFLVLDVGANLVHAALRDHRVGFLVLSLSGLGILAVMVLTTLRRDAFRAWTARLEGRLRGWD